MAVVDTIIWLLMGLIAGVLAILAVHRSMPREPRHWVGALVLGLVGGWLGGWLAGVLGLEAVTWLGSLIVAFVAAAAILLILRRVGSRPETA